MPFGQTGTLLSMKVKNGTDGVMAANIEKRQLSDVRTLKNCIKRSERSSESLNNQFFLVQCLERYLLDPSFKSYTGCDVDGHCDAYDVTITDGDVKLKCVLSPKLNCLVQKGEILPGCVIKLTHCSLRYDETDLGGLNFILIKALEAADYNNYEADVGDGSDIVWSPDSCDGEKEQLPLAAKRGCYISLWSSFETYGQVWEQEAQYINSVGSSVTEESYTIKELAKHWRSLKMSYLPPLIVRVLRKSRIRLYAKPQKRDKWPYQVYLVIGDRSGSCTAVIWNSLCAKLYYNIQEGSVLLLERYRVKPHYNVFTDQQSASLGDLPHYDMEINLNPHHPEARVDILQAGAVQEDWELPPLPYDLVTRKQLGSLPDNFTCEIVGVVKSVGRYERLATQTSGGPQAGSKDSGMFWIVRWIELLDDTHSKPFLIKVFRSGQPSLLDSVCPGQVLLFSCVRVLHHLDLTTNSRQSRHVYLTSTGDTQVTEISQENIQEHDQYPIIKKVTSWAWSGEGKRVGMEATIGGYVSFPPLPSELEVYKSGYTEKNPMQIIPSDQWEPVIQNLSYRENRIMIVQASIVRICHHHRSGRDKGKGRKRQRPESDFRTDVLYQCTDLEDSLSGMAVLGNTDLESGTLPFKYSPSHKAELLAQTAFPASIYASNQSTLTTDVPQAMLENFSYLMVTLLGLNHPVAVSAIHLLHNPLPATVNFGNLLRGILDTDTGERGIPTRERGIPAISGGFPSRWLCHLDLHRMDKDRVEIILNTAYPLS